MAPPGSEPAGQEPEGKGLGQAIVRTGFSQQLLVAVSGGGALFAGRQPDVRLGERGRGPTPLAGQPERREHRGGGLRVCVHRACAPTQ